MSSILRDQVHAAIAAGPLPFHRILERVSGQAHAILSVLEEDQETGTVAVDIRGGWSLVPPPIPVADNDPRNCGRCWACLGDSYAGMVLCTLCGFKRCPHANDHRFGCTESNEPGQPGSAYPALPDLDPEQFRGPSEYEPPPPNPEAVITEHLLRCDVPTYLGDTGPSPTAAAVDQVSAGDDPKGTSWVVTLGYPWEQHHRGTIEPPPERGSLHHPSAPADIRHGEPVSRLLDRDAARPLSEVLEELDEVSGAPPPPREHPALGVGPPWGERVTDIEEAVEHLKEWAREIEQRIGLAFKSYRDPLKKLEADVEECRSQDVRLHERADGHDDRLLRLEHPTPAGPIAPPLGIHIERLSERKAVVASLRAWADLEEDVNGDETTAMTLRDAAARFERGEHIDFPLPTITQNAAPSRTESQ